MIPTRLLLKKISSVDLPDSATVVRFAPFVVNWPHLLAVGDASGTLQIVSCVETDKDRKWTVMQNCRLQRHSAEITDIAWSPIFSDFSSNSSNIVQTVRLITCSADRSLRVWRLDSCTISTASAVVWEDEDIELVNNDPQPRQFTLTVESEFPLFPAALKGVAWAPTSSSIVVQGDIPRDNEKNSSDKRKKIGAVSVWSQRPDNRWGYVASFNEPFSDGQREVPFYRRPSWDPWGLTFACPWGRFSYKSYVAWYHNIDVVEKKGECDCWSLCLGGRKVTDISAVKFSSFCLVECDGECTVKPLE
eukprot:Platyproteum_vivax@DN12634_c0_g1_i1.p1